MSEIFYFYTKTVVYILLLIIILLTKLYKNYFQSKKNHVTNQSFVWIMMPHIFRLYQQPKHTLYDKTLITEKHGKLFHQPFLSKYSKTCQKHTKRSSSTLYCVSYMEEKETRELIKIISSHGKFLKGNT